MAAPILKGLAASLVAAAVAVAAAGPAHAQAYQCHAPARVSVPRITPEGPERRMPITGYTLSLSWSPEFCRARESEPAHARQCSGREGRYGLVVHGLWPQGAKGSPQWCGTARQPSSAELRANMCMSPSARLLTRQWAKHGSCMARRPANYFKVTRVLFEGLRIPDLDRFSREERLTAGFLRERFVDANPGWREEAVGIELNKRGWLEEIRLCYDRRFMPTRCSRGRSGAPDSARVRIWRGL